MGVQNKENNSHCQLIKRAMRIAFAIYPRMNAMRDRSRYNGDRSLLRAGSPFGSRSPSLSRPTFGCHLCRAMECTGPDSTSVPCFRFVPPFRSDNETRLRDMNESSFPARAHPPRAGSAAGLPPLPLPRAHPIAGVPGIPWALRSTVSPLIFPPIKSNVLGHDPFRRINRRFVHIDTSGVSQAVRISSRSDISRSVRSTEWFSYYYFSFVLTFYTHTIILYCKSVVRCVFKAWM